MNYVYSNILSSDDFKKCLGGFKIKLLVSTGNDRGTLRNNYNGALRFLKEQFENEGIARIRAIYSAILESISVVQIDVWDPTNGPKIFDALNSRQEPMTIGDLVRNEIFSRVAAEEPSVIEQIDEHNWQPFYKKFQQNNQNHFDGYFFPYGLVQNPNLKKSEVYNNLRESWDKGKTPAEIIKALSEYQDAFIDIICGTNYQNHKKTISKALSNLTLSGLPSSTLPFLMRLSNAIRDALVTEIAGLEILSVIESFLVRRAVCGHEPTGLHAVFKRLWNDCSEIPTGSTVIAALKKHRTVVWPAKSDFVTAIETRSLYGAAITPYLLIQYDESLQGDIPNIIPWIEHVLPEKPVPDWFNKFTIEEHVRLKDTFANLIPLTAVMNRKLGNKEYAKKRDKYTSSSSFKSARQFGNDYADWTPGLLEKRSKKLSAWAVIRWKY